MKPRFTFCLMALVLSFGVKAQTEPFDQFFYKSLWSNLPRYDSIAIWNDTVSPTNSEGGYRVDFDANGMIDTMFYKDQLSGKFTSQYSSIKTANSHTNFSQFQTGNTLIPYMRTIFQLDVSNRVSEVFIADYNINGYEEHSKFKVAYKTDGNIESILYSIANGIGYLNVSFYMYYYTDNRLDSVLDKWFYNGQAMQKYILEYNSNGDLTGMRYFDDSGMGLEENVRHKFINSAQNSVYDHIYLYDQGTSNFELYHVYEYRHTKHYGVALPSPVMEPVKIYPNPAQDVIRISGKDLNTYKIFDLNGRIVKEGKANGDIHVEHLPGGTYLLNVCDKYGHTHTEKIVKSGF